MTNKMDFLQKTKGTSNIFIFFSQKNKNPTDSFEETMLFNEITIKIITHMSFIMLIDLCGWNL